NHRVVVSGTGVQETELEDQPERLHPIPPPDVLAFCVGATVVADRNLIDASTPLSEASSHLRLDAEAIAGQPQTLEYVSANRLVPRFHVRELEVVRHVRRQRQEGVAECVPEEQDSPLLTGWEA